MATELEIKDGADLEIKDGPEKEKRLAEIIDIQVKALDDLVTVNSLFTLAVFVGLAFAAPGQRSLENRVECDADVNSAKRLIVLEVVSFSCYLLSSLVAKTLKMHLNVLKLYNSTEFHPKLKDFTKSHPKLNDSTKSHPDLFSRSGWMLYLSTSGSVIGCVFLTLSMVEVIQIRLGKLSCGSVYSLSGAILLIVIVFLALLIYVPTTRKAISDSMKEFRKYSPQKEQRDLETGDGRAQ